MNKINTSHKETFFLDLDMKVVSGDIHVSVTLRRISPCWVVMFLGSGNWHGIYISQLVSLARCCAYVF